MSSFDKKVAIMCHDISVNLKMSPKSLMVFHIAEFFTLIIYELPAIALPSNQLMSKDYFNQQMEGAQLDKNKIKVDCISNVATSFEYGQHKDHVQSAVEDAAAFYCTNMNKEEAKRDRFYAKLEFLTLSRLYSKSLADSKHYNWHILVSQVHTPKEKHLHTIYTNHS